MDAWPKRAHVRAHTGRLAAALVAALTAGFGASAAAASGAADFGKERPSASARAVADWSLRSGDHGRGGFAVIDKVQARLYVFDAQGRLQGAAPVLLGLAKGDDSFPGIGEKPLSAIKRHERTTPAGRFAAEPGRNNHGEDIVWVDYDAAVSMHRVRPLKPQERRLQRLASPTPKDNRISYGCINVPAAFYDKVVVPTFVQQRGVVYVLPEKRSLTDVFPSARADLAAVAAAPRASVTKVHTAAVAPRPLATKKAPAPVVQAVGPVSDSERGAP